MLNVNILLEHPKAIMPFYATDGAAAFDLFSVESEIIYPHQSVIFNTGVKIEVPEDHVLLIFSRSGHGFKNDIRLSNCVGVIDHDYRGLIKVKLAYDRVAEPPYSDAFEVFEGDRIAQGIIFPFPRVGFTIVSELSETARGENGFGHTGR